MWQHFSATVEGRLQMAYHEKDVINWKSAVDENNYEVHSWENLRYVTLVQEYVAF